MLLIRESSQSEARLSGRNIVGVPPLHTSVAAQHFLLKHASDWLLSLINNQSRVRWIEKRYRTFRLPFTPDLIHSHFVNFSSLYEFIAYICRI